MALNLVYRNDNKKNRVEDLGETHAPGTPVLSLAGEPAVTITGSGNYTRTEVIEGVGTLSGIAAGGVGLEGTEVTLAFDGTWEFDAEAFGGTLPTGLEQGDEITLDGDDLATTGGTPFGTVDYPKDYDKTRGFIPVKIGA